MKNLYNAMDNILAARDSVSSFLEVLGVLSKCSDEDIKKTAPAVLNVARAVLGDVERNQSEAVRIIDRFLADNIKDNR